MYYGIWPSGYNLIINKHYEMAFYYVLQFIHLILYCKLLKNKPY